MKTYNLKNDEYIGVNISSFTYLPLQLSLKHNLNNGIHSDCSYKTTTEEFLGKDYNHYFHYQWYDYLTCLFLHDIGIPNSLEEFVNIVINKLNQ